MAPRAASSRSRHLERIPRETRLQATTVALVAVGLSLWAFAGLGCRGSSTATTGDPAATDNTPCSTCPACGPDGSCETSFCSPVTCSSGRCVPRPGPCSDGDAHTWDRCDASRNRCSAYLADDVRSCSQSSDCGTDQPCQQFDCIEGRCRLTEESRFCGDALQRPVSCRSHDDCLRHVLWQLSHPEKALVSLSGGPWCGIQQDGGQFCQWLEAPRLSKSRTAQPADQIP